MLEEKDPKLLKAIPYGFYQHIQKKKFERSIDVALPPNLLPETSGGRMLSKEEIKELKKKKIEIEDRIKQRYFRPVIANKEGMIVHNGDCGV